MSTTTTEQDARDRADMARLVAGHDASLNDLMERHAPAVFGFLCRMLGNATDANDLAEETFVRVYQSRDRYHPHQRFTNWLYTIAANLARNHLRWRARHPAQSMDAELQDSGPRLGDELATETPDPNQQLAQDEQKRMVREAVGKLPDDLREALVLFEWESLSMAEIAEILGTTPKAVESRLYRARQQLRSSLESLLSS